MDYIKIYVLFQFELDYLGYSEVYAKKFKFFKNFSGKKNEIDKYFKATLSEKKNELFKNLVEVFTIDEGRKPETYKDYCGLLNRIEDNLVADWEIISKEEYQSWKEVKKVENEIIYE